MTRREYGEVFLGLQSAVVRDKAGKSTKIRVPRAVKMASNEQMKDDFVREALIMLQLGDHDNIVRMVGVAVQQSPCTATSTSFWTLSEGCVGFLPPRTRCALCSTWLPCLSDADWCLRSDVMTGSCLQGWRCSNSCNTATSGRCSRPAVKTILCVW